MLLVVGFWLVGSGGHWLITPIDHPGATAARVIAVWVQSGLGVLLLVMGNRWHQRERRTLGPRYSAVVNTTLLALVGAACALSAAHWLILPNGNGAAWRVAGAWLQLAVGVLLLGLAAWRPAARKTT
jgi:peptidoglycan biosynthesis protein MviN/MurJ (putative lipid II flippase)